MTHQEILELVYHITGIIAIFIGVLVAYVFATRDVGFIKSRIFLKYDLFKLGFFILVAGMLIFAAANFLAIFDHHVFHEYGEVVYNLSIIAFITTIYIILNPWRKKW